MSAEGAETAEHKLATASHLAWAPLHRRRHLSVACQLARAAAEDRILITTDTDFPTLLALAGDAIPSVILLRGVGDSIQARLAAVLIALPSIREELEAGAVAVVERDRVPLRTPPIEPT